MTKIDIEYLDKLTKDCQEIKKKIQYRNILLDNLTISYLVTKNHSFIGYHQGYYEQIVQHQYKLKESAKIRANSKNYLEIYRDKSNDIVQIVKYCNGHIDCIHQSYMHDNKRYLVPFSSTGGFYPTYIYVTVYNDADIIEEYAIEGRQIIYDKYMKESDKQIAFSRINYVVGGNVPILEEMEGLITIDPLSYNEIDFDNWIRHR